MEDPKRGLFEKEDFIAKENYPLCILLKMHLTTIYTRNHAVALTYPLFVNTITYTILTLTGN
jgi:hypothetical protein